QGEEEQSCPDIDDVHTSSYPSLYSSSQIQLCCMSTCTDLKNSSGDIKKVLRWGGIASRFPKIVPRRVPLSGARLRRPCRGSTWVATLRTALSLLGREGL